MTVRFDNSLPTLIEVIRRELGEEILSTGRVLRDVTGRLAFFSAQELNAETIDRVANALRQKLGSYARTDRVLAGKGDYGVDVILSDIRSLTLYVGGDTIQFLDRRLVGVDWLRLPARTYGGPPRFVFVSIKGGVGRSTALSITAAHLASQGKRILVVDLDMEAPGLGAMLLDSQTTPRYGIVDALIENSLSGLDPIFLADLVGPSDLAHKAGRIDVLPAFGTESINNPADILAKIARAYAEVTDSHGNVATILDQVRTLIDKVTTLNRYDAVLVDARAGLHETLPAAMMGLGAAEIFLFGLNEPQTFQGYRALFGHLFRLLRGKAERDEFLDRLTLVHAKANADDATHAEFVEKCKTLFRDSEHVPQGPVEADPQPPAEPFSDVPWDDEEISDDELGIEPATLVHEPVPILHDDRFRHFDPSRRNDLLMADIYGRSYQQFLERIDVSIKASGGEKLNA